jgi:predicted Zn-dependent peptidase
LNCPHNWDFCELCLNKLLCESGIYKPEEEKEPEKPQEVIEEPVKEVEREKPKEGTLEWLYRTHPPDYNVKEVLPLDGAMTFGGGSSSKRRKQPAKKVPEYLKTWGL